MFVKKTGMNRIATVVNSFNTMITDLESGIDEVDVEIEKNEVAIDEIKTRNVELTDARAQASSLMNGIRKMMKNTPGGSFI